MTSVLLYLGSILLANILVIKFGLVTFFGVTFPAGAAVIGLTFSARDFVQRRWGKWAVWAWMLCACLITVLFNQKIALASAGAFLIAESVDWLIYTIVKRPFRDRIILSNLVGTPLDSAAFVMLAFGWHWPAIWGQTLVKFISSLVVLPWARKS